MNYDVPETQQAPAAQVDPDARLWAAFATASSTEAVCRGWLALQCRSLPGVSGAMVLLARQGGPFQPLAVWPDASQDFSFLRSIAEECVRTGNPVVHRPPHESGATGLHVAYPFLADVDQPVGAVVLDLVPRPEAEIKATLRNLHWGVGWLEAQAVRDRMGRDKQRLAGAAAALDIVAVVNEHDRAEAAAMAVANEMATRLAASRVAVGLNGRRGMRLAALSHTAWFKRNTTMVAGIEQAMDEAVEQRVTVRVPAASGDAVRIQVAHEALASTWDANGAFMTFPLLTDRGPAGAITVLHETPPPDAVVRLGEAICALLGPILEHKRRARRWVSGRLFDGARDAIAATIGARHLGWKLAAGVAACALTASLLIPTQFRVSAKAVLEGRVQLAVPAPFDGFIATAPAKAGDRVHAGDLLATLDDHDLQLDRVRWQSEHERLILKSREAMSKHDPGTSGQLDAELRETDAQAQLTAVKLTRTHITAPIDGILVSGDMSQQIGAPVETGKVLFEVAPLDQYRVIVRLDERDISYVVPGQTGHLLLQGMSGDSIPFTVRRVTSVAEPDAGHNTFRVEGELDSAPSNLRPGMEGIGKIDIAEHSYAWVWTRGLRDWARMLIWTWTP
jgi:Barrel-sandwich domain of CusB or HlyD membrane-fusion